VSASRPSPSDGEEGRAGGSAARPFRLRAVLFDFDGTLTHPGALDFAAIKREVGCPPDQFVLEWIRSLPAGEARDASALALERFELAAADASAPNAGAEELVRWLRTAGLAVGILTRNGLSAIERSLRRFTALTLDDFDVVVTRDDGDIAPKPAPDGVLHAAAAMGVLPEETLVVGDFLLDVRAGRAAGAVTAFLVNHGAPGDGEVAEPDAADCDFVVGRLDELEDVVRSGLPLAPGKLPNDLLAGFLAGAAGDDPAVLVPPRVGEDAAALDLAGAELLVAHGDPITLGGEAQGRAAVLVNVNDIAASGAEPRWLLATVLLPAGTTPSQALAQLHDLAAAAAEAGVTLVGGHTEITDAVARPVISLSALGTLRRAELKDKRSARAGDRILLTKALAMEGAALLAEELGERLHALGMSEAELGACRALRELASIRPEARIARDVPGVRAMHDVTEGGLATALRELAAATGHGVVFHRDRVPVSPETRRVCQLLEADPLGLIASGSLLICCDPAGAERLAGTLEAAAIQATDIGELTEQDAGVVALERDRPAPWPTFDVDEAARLLVRPGEQHEKD
jgi:HAD superfamily hydrolase (TIGR01509 family)